MKYLLSFTGRKVGAIGVFYPIKLVIDAPDAESAISKAYETHEHMTGLKVRELEA